MNQNSPIGVFDSGLGGLTVLQAIKDLLPNESLIYFGDTARVPYGSKSAATVTHFSEQIVGFLRERDVKIIVIACNTASSVALENLKSKNNIPIIGVIEPGVKAAAKVTKTNSIGVIGTTATINSNSYPKVFKTIQPASEVKCIPCPLFVPLVEEGWIEGDVPEMIAQSYLSQFSESSVDTVILGCTHYPILKHTIQKTLTNKVTLVDSAITVAKEVEINLRKLKLLADKTDSTAKLECFVTDLPQKFGELGRRFLGQDIPNVTLIHID